MTPEFVRIAVDRYLVKLCSTTFAALPCEYNTAESQTRCILCSRGCHKTEEVSTPTTAHQCTAAMTTRQSRFTGGSVWPIESR
eukprot:m.442331 g.442331  ORF g.442331 m.442331 type:complete len:83 (-) comp18790_c0_seq1:123-371(-)